MNNQTRLLHLVKGNVLYAKQSPDCENGGETMCFEKFVQNKVVVILNDERDYTIIRNRIRGHSDTFTICNHLDIPVYIAKFFDYLPDLKDEIGRDHIKHFEYLADLLDRLE